MTFRRALAVVVAVGAAAVGAGWRFQGPPHATANGSSRAAAVTEPTTGAASASEAVGAAAAPTLATAPEAMRTLVARFALDDAVAEYRRLSPAELILQMDDLRSERQALEAETQRLDGEHSAALSAGDRSRIVELRREIVATVDARNRLAAALLLAGYVQSLSAPRDRGM